LSTLLNTRLASVCQRERGRPSLCLFSLFVACLVAGAGGRWLLGVARCAAVFAPLLSVCSATSNPKPQRGYATSAKHITKRESKQAAQQLERGSTAAQHAQVAERQAAGERATHRTADRHSTDQATRPIELDRLNPRALQHTSMDADGDEFMRPAAEATSVKSERTDTSAQRSSAQSSQLTPAHVALDCFPLLSQQVCPSLWH